MDTPRLRTSGNAFVRRSSYQISIFDTQVGWYGKGGKGRKDTLCLLVYLSGIDWLYYVSWKANHQLPIVHFYFCSDFGSYFIGSHIHIRIHSFTFIFNYIPYLIIQTFPLPSPSLPSSIRYILHLSSPLSTNLSPLSLSVSRSLPSSSSSRHFRFGPFSCFSLFLLRIYFPFSFSNPHIFFINSYRLVENVRSSAKFVQIDLGTKQTSGIAFDSPNSI